MKRVLTSAAAAAAAAASLIGVVAAAAPASAATGDIVKNGSFEQPVVTASRGYDLYSSIPSWSVQAACPDDTTCDPNPVLEVDRSAIFGGAGPFGQQNLETDSNYSTIVYQKVTAAGAQRDYVLTVTYAARPGYGPDDNAMNVGVDVSKPISITADGRGLAAPQWQTASYNVRLPGKTAQLFIADDGISNGLGMLVDNISLTPAAA